MAEPLEIKIEGLEPVAAALKAWPKRVLPVMQDAVTEAAFVVERQSKKAVTEGYTRALDTGTLRSQLVPRDRSSDGLSVSIYPLVRYAIFVHEGTRYMPARPFFKAAQESSMEQVVSIFEEAVKKIIA